MAELNLWFTRLEAGFCELEQSVFIRDLNETPLKAIRGKTSGAYQDVGNFQWTPGVKAVACIFLTALLRHLKKQKNVLPILEGAKDSLASSLDYALNKQPQWLFDMFGTDDDANAYLRQLLLRRNAGRRRGKLVRFSLNEQLISPSSVKVYIEDALIQDVKMLEVLLESITLRKDEEAKVISLTKARQKLEAKNNGSNRNGSNKRVVIFISLGRNVGGALIINGSLHHGANWGDGEFGQILLTTDPNARQDSSGAIGTLEAYCSGPGLVQTFRELTGADPKKDIIADAKQNPYGPSSAAVKKTGEYLGYGLVSLANALDPDLIVIGGSLSKLGDALLGPARQILKQRALTGPANCPIVQAKSEADVPIGYLAS